MKKRLAFLAVWLGGTVASILLAWSAVSIVGGQVTDDAGGPMSADDVARAVAITTLPRVDPSSSLSTTRVTMAAPVSTIAPTTSPATSPTTAAAAPSSVASTPAPPISTGQSGGGTIPAETTPPPAPSPDANTLATTNTTVPPQNTSPPAGPLQYFQGNGGSTGMRCSGESAALAFATPSAGWTMSVHDSGPEKVDVEFNDAQDNRSRIVVRCNGGGVASAEVKER